MKFTFVKWPTGKSSTEKQNMVDILMKPYFDGYSIFLISRMNYLHITALTYKAVA